MKRALYAVATVFFLLAGLAAMASGAEPEFARSAAIMWLLALPLFGIGAAALLATVDLR
jgi:hypothetical protein